MNRNAWKALHHDLRASWRQMGGARIESLTERFTHGGAPWKLSRRFTALGRVVETVAEPVIIRDRSPGYRAAIELAWARHFKAEARNAYPRETMRPRKLDAARACIADARDILAARSAFHALP